MNPDAYVIQVIVLLPGRQLTFIIVMEMIVTVIVTAM